MKKQTKTTSKRPKLPVLHRLIRDMSSEAYHGTEGTWSSSQLKDIIEDEDIFIRKYITKEIPRMSSEAFDTGTYLHTGVLEPHKVSKEIAIFEGKTRFGKVWDAFKKKHEDSGKMIITAKQKEQGDGMIRAVRASPVCVEHIQGIPEVSLFVHLVVYKGKIYAPYFGKELTMAGWEDSSVLTVKGGQELVSKKGFELIVKVRADCLGNTFVSDLKSTSGKATQSQSIRQSISKYKYDLSAALYLDLFNLVQEDVSAFVWIFASKENPCAASWFATKNQLLVGRAKWSWAVKRLADLSAAGWEIPDYLREAEPLPHEMEWLNTKDSDLL